MYSRRFTFSIPVTIFSEYWGDTEPGRPENEKFAEWNRINREILDERLPRVEDAGEGITFCVYVYNVQPGIRIDYRTGKSNNDGSDFDTDDGKNDNIGKEDPEGEKASYILVTSTKKYHTPDCTYGKNAKEENKESVTLSKEEIEAQGYIPCGSCKP